MSNFTKDSIERKLKELEYYDEVQEHNELYFSFQDSVISILITLRKRLTRALFF